jgi:hypothetical protein
MQGEVAWIQMASTAVQWLSRDILTEALVLYSGIIYLLYGPGLCYLYEIDCIDTRKPRLHQHRLVVIVYSSRGVSFGRGLGQTVIQSQHWIESNPM